MIKNLIIFISLTFSSSVVFAQGYDIFSLGIYDIKFDGSQTDSAADFRYERRFDNSIFEIGPESENFFYLKPFAGIETTSDSATYILLARP